MFNDNHYVNYRITDSLVLNSDFRELLVFNLSNNDDAIDRNINQHEIIDLLSSNDEK